MIDLLERKPTVAPALPRFHYVIFADGETCDATGLEAAAGNDFVLFDDRVYAPGEDIVIDGRQMWFSRVAYLTGPAAGGRRVSIIGCTLRGPAR